MRRKLENSGIIKMIQKILLLAAAGAVGTLARYWLGGFVQKASSGVFPWGTLAVNMAGCFLFGFVWSLAEERLVISGTTRLVALVGFMGAFTTFSSFVFESSALMRDSQWLWAFGNVVFQNVAGLALMALGMAAGRAV